MDYTDRRLVAVTISGLVLGGDRVSAQIGIALSTPEAEHAFGPKLSIEIAVPLSEDSTIEGLQKKLLESAASLLQRLSQEDGSSLLAGKLAWEQTLRSPVEIDLSSLELNKTS